jgi:hypothetical protein
LFCNEERLIDARDVEFEVITLGANEDENIQLQSNKAKEVLMRFIDQGDPFILDIDLDYFSTRNPFNQLYKNADLYSELKEIYNFSLPNEKNSNDIEKTLALRHSQMKQLAEAWAYIEKNNNLDGFTGNLIPISKIESLAAKVRSFYNDVDWMMIHEAGCTCDETGLPEHVSTKSEIKTMIESSFS